MRTVKSKLYLFLPLGFCLAALLTVLVLSAAVSARDDGQNDSETVPLSQETVIEQEPEEPEEPPLTLETLPALAFTDIAEDDPSRDVLRYAVHFGYMGGISEDTFAPLETASRAAVITVLHRMSGEEAPAYDGRFTDVEAGIWYEAAVAWGVDAGIVGGVSEDSFAPDRPITRSQLAAMLSRFAAYLGHSTTPAGDLSAYLDASKVEPYAVEPLSWALENDMYRTSVRDEILPDMPVSRLQLANALVALSAVQGDALAAEIVASLPEKAETVSVLDREAAQLAVDEAATKYGAICVQVAVIKGGAVTDTFAYGWATRDTDPMTANHKVRIASISKVAVGVAAMILREDGIIDLDESIGTYWGIKTANPYYKDVPVSIRTILTHTSSIVNAGDDVSRAYDNVRSKLQNGYYSKMKPGAPGSWSYNNYAFSVLGMTLELASGEYLTDVLRDRLFTAMDIDGAFYAGEIENTDLLATLYRNGGAVARSVATQKDMKNPAHPGDSGSPFAGGLVISAADLGKLVVLLTGDGVYEGVQLLDAESVALMETVFPVSDGSSQGIPLRWRSNVYGRDEIYYHTGSAYAVFNCMSYDPATGDGVVVLTTGAVGSKDENNIYKIASEIASHMYAQMEEN